jgi:pyruvate dehydrogenase E2 component (dihydrolipoamide acetyltransferase)
MSIPITVPPLGWNMEEGTFGGWLKGDGDPIRPGDRIFALESEKATEEVESLDGGVLRIPADGPKPGDRLAVGTVIGFLETSVGTTGRPMAVPPGGPLAERAERAVDPLVMLEERRPAADSRSESATRPITPRARRIARELGVDCSTLTGTGRNGRIRERDVRTASGSSFQPHTAIRRTIAARMVESQRATAPVTLTTTADATNLVALRGRFKADGDKPVPSYTDLIVKLSAEALRAHPLLTGRWTEEGVRFAEAVHIGIAVDTDAGLMVPVVRNLATVTIHELAVTTLALIEKARAGRLTAADMQGGCFTVTNLGAFGIDAFTPIINYPECAVLGVGRIARKPAVVGDAIVPRDQVTLSLTFDHRIVDGAPAARFLRAIVQAIENPARLSEPGA